MFNRPGSNALNTDICWAEYERVKEFLPKNKHVNVGTIGTVKHAGEPLSIIISSALKARPPVVEVLQP